MGRVEAKMSSKGQLTVPAELRRLLDLKEGDRVDFFFDPATREVTLRARNLPVDALFGVAGTGTIAINAIDRTVEDAAAEDDRRATTPAARRGEAAE